MQRASTVLRFIVAIVATQIISSEAEFRVKTISNITESASTEDPAAKSLTTIQSSSNLAPIYASFASPSNSSVPEFQKENLTQNGEEYDLKTKQGRKKVPRSYFQHKYKKEQLAGNRNNETQSDSEKWRAYSHKLLNNQKIPKENVNKYSENKNYQLKNPSDWASRILEKGNNGQEVAHGIEGTGQLVAEAAQATEPITITTERTRIRHGWRVRKRNNTSSEPSETQTAVSVSGEHDPDPLHFETATSQAQIPEHSGDDINSSKYSSSYTQLEPDSRLNINIHDNNEEMIKTEEDRQPLEQVVAEASATEKKENQDESKEKSGGEEHESEEHGSKGEKSKKSYNSKHDEEKVLIRAGDNVTPMPRLTRSRYLKVEKGFHDKEAHKGEYGDAKKSEHSHEEEDVHYEAGDEEEAGKKKSEHEQHEEYKKGHSTRGGHVVHKKDEYEKKTEFFDEDDDDGHGEKYGEFYEDHDSSKGGHKKGGHYDGSLDASHKTKKGHYGKGTSHSEDKGFKGNKGMDTYHQHHESHGKKKSEDKQHEYKFVKGKPKTTGGNTMVEPGSTQYQVEDTENYEDEGAEEYEQEPANESYEEEEEEEKEKNASEEEEEGSPSGSLEEAPNTDYRSLTGREAKYERPISRKVTIPQDTSKNDDSRYPPIAEKNSNFYTPSQILFGSPAHSQNNDLKHENPPKPQTFQSKGSYGTQRSPQTFHSENSAKPQIEYSYAEGSSIEYQKPVQGSLPRLSAPMQSGSYIDKDGPTSYYNRGQYNQNKKASYQITEKATETPYKSYSVVEPSSSRIHRNSPRQLSKQYELLPGTVSRTPRTYSFHPVGLTSPVTNTRTSLTDHAYTPRPQNLIHVSSQKSNLPRGNQPKRLQILLPSWHKLPQEYHHKEPSSMASYQIETGFQPISVSTGPMQT